MAISYETAFALRDNPFRPTPELPSMIRKTLISEVDSRPLTIHREPTLEPLFSFEAGPFGEYFARFERALYRQATSVILRIEVSYHISS